MINSDNITRIHYDMCDSTNLRAREYLKEHSPDALLITASGQSAGRGRQGKSFFSPKDTGLYLTFAFRTSLALDSLCFVTTAAAAKVCAALETLCGRPLSIKWVNDIYCENKKICGTNHFNYYTIVKEKKIPKNIRNTYPILVDANVFWYLFFYKYFF